MPVKGQWNESVLHVCLRRTHLRPPHECAVECAGGWPRGTQSGTIPLPGVWNFP
jgi:hypothetical protein